MPDLFDLADLRFWLQVPQVDTETATRVRRYASGWLMSATGLSTWPTPVPDDLWAWGIELAGIAFRNPAAAVSESVDDYNVAYDRERRAEILRAAALSYATATGPAYSFPDPDWHWTFTPTTTTTE